MLRQPIVMTLVAVSAAVLSESTVFAFQPAGFVWPDADRQTIPFMLDPVGSDDAPGAVDAFRRAFTSWEAVSCSYLDFAERAWTSPRTATRDASDGENRVGFVESDWFENEGVLAVTYTTVLRGENPTIVDADIVFNGVNFTWTTDEGVASETVVDIETVMFHEVGHFFGLAHSSDEAAAMFASNNKGVQRGPAEDDVEGICALYPNGQPIPHDPDQDTGLPVGATCARASDCATELCIRDTDRNNELYCTAPCNPQGSDCPAGFLCELAEGSSDAYCLKPQRVDEICDLCEVHGHCATGLCSKFPGVNGFEPFCTTTCNPTPGFESTCPSGYRCDVTQQGATQLAVCIPVNGVCNPTGKGGRLQECYGNGTCKPGHRCLDFGAKSYCYLICATSQVGGSCGYRDSQCLFARENTAFCAEIRRPGQPCIPEQCDANSLCLLSNPSDESSASCYATCPSGSNEECGANYECQAFEGLESPVCVANEGFEELGEVCQSDAECISRQCVTYKGAKRCTKPCAVSDTSACETGLECVASTGASEGLCFPVVIDPDPDGDGVDAGYCACDSTNQCDEGCGCDPNCSSGCAASPGLDPSILLFYLLASIGLWWRGYSRRRPLWR